MRVDANVSVRKPGEPYRTRTELKNMNSFNFVARGIDAEVARQIQVYEDGGEVVAGDVRLRRRHRQADAAPLEGGGRGLPLLPRARPRAGRAAGRARRAPARGAARAARQADPPARGRPSASSSRTGSSRPAAPASTSARSPAGADARATANVVMNQLAGAGVDPDAVDPAELAKLVEARERIPRPAFAEALARERRPGLLGRPLPRRRPDHRRVRARAADRARPRREPRPGRGVPRRQGGPARLLRRPGDEGDAGQGEPAPRQRAAAREARRLAPRGAPPARRRVALLALLPAPPVAPSASRSRASSHAGRLPAQARQHLLAVDADRRERVGRRRRS